MKRHGDRPKCHMYAPSQPPTLKVMLEKSFRQKMKSKLNVVKYALRPSTVNYWQERVMDGFRKHCNYPAQSLISKPTQRRLGCIGEPEDEGEGRTICIPRDGSKTTSKTTRTNQSKMTRTVNVTSTQGHPSTTTTHFVTNCVQTTQTNQSKMTTPMNATSNQNHASTTATHYVTNCVQVTSEEAAARTTATTPFFMQHQAKNRPVIIPEPFRWHYRFQPVSQASPRFHPVFYPGGLPYNLKYQQFPLGY